MTKKLKDLFNNQSFCAIPFVSLMINTDTTVRYCCMVKGSHNKLKNENNNFYSCKDNFVRDAWNSSDLKSIRINMLNDNKIEGCKVCYLQEESGRTSNRQHANQEWSSRLGESQLENIIDQALENEGHIFDDLVYLDLRLGNLCNLKCRMCNPWNSSQIAKEHIELNEKDSDYASVWKKTFGRFPLTVMEDQVWFDHNIMWDQIISLIPKLKKVYMTGGEPTLIKNNFKFMQKCIEANRSDLLLFFNTNCTNLNKNWLEIIGKFKEIKINASIDGIGIVNEYIRSPSDWSAISNNVEQLVKIPSVHLGITPTVQVYNIFNIVDILQWVEYLNNKYNKNIFIDFLINIHPHHLNIDILPDDLRKQALDEILNFKETKMGYHPEATMNSLQGIIGLLQKPRNINWSEEVQRFKIYTESLDRERSQNLEDVDQRLYFWMNNVR